VRLPRVGMRALPARWRRRLLLAGLVAIALGALYLFWLRDSSLVRVEKVTVTGLNTPDAPRISETLTTAARQQTTLHVDEAALRRAVAYEPLVRDIRVVADFPHAMRIEVVENRPVAILSTGGKTSVPVAADGTVLEGAKLDTGLPTLKVGALPGGPRLGDGLTRDLVAVAGAAPPELLPRITGVEVRRGPGVVVALRHGPELWFGRPVELDQKWKAAAGVLAHRSSQGATYVDLRLPDRPVAGGLGMEEELQPGAEASGAGAVTGTVPVDPAAPVDPASGTTPETAGATGDPAAAQAAPTDPAVAPAAPPAPVPAAPPTTAAPTDPGVVNPQP
jgi:hypothetical protein